MQNISEQNRLVDNHSNSHLQEHVLIRNGTYPQILLFPHARVPLQSPEGVVHREIISICSLKVLHMHLQQAKLPAKLITEILHLHQFRVAHLACCRDNLISGSPDNEDLSWVFQKLVSIVENHLLHNYVFNQWCLTTITEFPYICQIYLALQRLKLFT